MKFRPCIDLHNGFVKQIVGGTFQNDSDPQTNYTSKKTPSWFAEIYSKQNFSEGHIIKLGPGNDQSAKEALAASPKKFQIGGGINLENAKEWLTAGASKVIITSWLFTDNQIDIEKIKKLADIIGEKNIVLDLSCRRRNDLYYVVTNNWQDFTNTIVNKELLQNLSQYCSEFLIHAVDVEGLRSGIDEDLICIIKDSPITCVYAGGISSINDLKRISDLSDNRLDVTIGSALDIFGGNLSFQDIIDFFS